MALVYRPAIARDLEPAQQLVVRSINELTERHGFGPMAVVRPTLFQSFLLKDDPGGLWVAEDSGELVGCAFSWVCGDLWFLAELFVSPGHQGRGIGNELMQRASDHARRRGATNKALITFAFNTVSQGLYIRHGIFPRLPIYYFSGAGGAQPEPPPAGLNYAPVEDSAPHLRGLARIDMRTLGVSREKHHAHLIRDVGLRGLLFGEDNDPIGYAYISPDGHIGPLAVVEPSLLAAVFKTALRLAAVGGSSRVSAFIPGTSDAALTIATEHGMRVAFPMVLASAHDFGNWTQYFPRNPGFM